MQWGKQKKLGILKMNKAFAFLKFLFFAKQSIHNFVTSKTIFWFKKWHRKRYINASCFTFFFQYSTIIVLLFLANPSFIA